MSVMRHQKIR